MASIETRTNAAGQTSYRIKIRLKGHPTQTATFERKTDAKRWITQTEAAIREGRYFKMVEAERHTLADLINRYARDVLPSKKKKTQEPQIEQLAWWKSELGHYSLNDCTSARISETRDKLANKQTRLGTTTSPATVNRHLVVLSHAFNIAIKEWDWLEQNPLLRVSKPREPRGRVRFLSGEERTRLLEACQHSYRPELYVAVVLSLSTGGRQGEIMSLTSAQAVARKIKGSASRSENTSSVASGIPW